MHNQGAFELLPLRMHKLCEIIRINSMKRIFFVIAFLVCSCETIRAQDSLPATSDSVYTKVDVLPEFPGGMKALGKYVDGKNHHYPKEAQVNKIEGKVIIQFVINEDGTTTDFKVVKGIGYGCDEAALEAFKKMPKWKPATVGGKPVKFQTQMGYLYKL
jgi:periplasmic protein TonB